MRLKICYLKHHFSRHLLNWQTKHWLYHWQHLQRAIGKVMASWQPKNTDNDNWQLAMMDLLFFGGEQHALSHTYDFVVLECMQYGLQSVITIALLALSSCRGFLPRSSQAHLHHGTKVNLLCWCNVPWPIVQQPQPGVVGHEWDKPGWDECGVVQGVVDKDVPWRPPCSTIFRLTRVSGVNSWHHWIRQDHEHDHWMTPVPRFETSGSCHAGIDEWGRNSRRPRSPRPKGEMKQEGKKQKIMPKEEDTEPEPMIKHD